jgi:hypothetical protein
MMVIFSVWSLRVAVKVKVISNSVWIYIVSRLHHQCQEFSKSMARIPEKNKFKGLSFSTNNFYLNDLISYCSRFEGLCRKSRFSNW